MLIEKSNSVASFHRQIPQDFKPEFFLADRHEEQQNTKSKRNLFKNKKRLRKNMSIDLGEVNV
jgi:hypothetical protein